MFLGWCSCSPRLFPDVTGHKDGCVEGHKDGCVDASHQCHLMEPGPIRDSCVISRRCGGSAQILQLWGLQVSHISLFWLWGRWCSFMVKHDVKGAVLYQSSLFSRTIRSPSTGIGLFFFMVFLGPSGHHCPNCMCREHKHEHYQSCLVGKLCIL